MVTLNLAGDNQHWQIDLQEARNLYRVKVFSASAYLLAILKIHGKAGWKWSFRVADFCAASGIPESSLYYALSRLKLRGLIRWQLRGRVVVWWEETVSNPYPEPVLQKFRGNLQEFGENLQEFGENLQEFGEEDAETLDQQEVGDFLKSSSDLPSNPPQAAEEERNFSEKPEGEAAQEEEVLEGSQDVITPFNDLHESPQILSSENKLSSKEEEDVDEDAYLQWVIHNHLPTTQDYQEGRIRDPRRYALKCIENDGTGALKKQFVQSLKESEHQLRCQEMEQRVADRRCEWEAAGHRLAIYFGDSGFPVVVHEGISIDGSDFLNMPVPASEESDRDRPKELPAAALVGKQILLARQELNKIQSKLRSKTFYPGRNWADKLIDWWQYEALRAQIEEIVKGCSELGLIIENESLLYDF